MDPNRLDSKDSPVAAWGLLVFTRLQSAVGGTVFGRLWILQEREPHWRKWAVGGGFCLYLNPTFHLPLLLDGRYTMNSHLMALRPGPSMA